jgi:hypothetical protein
MRRIRFLAAVFIAGSTAGALPAAADEFKIRSPIIDYREIEIEHFGQTTFDKRKSGLSNNQFYNNEIEIGVLPWLKLGLEGNFEAPSGKNLQYDATGVESFIQLTPQGKYFADLGFFVEAERPRQRGDEPDGEIVFGPLVQSELGHVGRVGMLHTFNLLFEKTVGRNSSSETPIKLAWQSRLRIDPLFQPGIEYFGEVNSGEPAQHRFGPVIAGDLSLSQFGLRGTIRSEVAYLAGLTNATERGTVRWHMEYEIPF